MPKRAIEMNLDFAKKDNFTKFEVKQFDNVILNINLFENGLSYNASGTTKLYVGCLDDVFKQEKNITVNGNKVSINLDKNILANKCIAYAEIELTDEQGTSTSSTFIFKIVSKIGEGATLPGSIEGFVEKYNNLIAQLKDEAAKINANIESSADTLVNNVAMATADAIEDLRIDYDKTKVEILYKTGKAIEDIDTRFKALTIEQQQDAEVIDARDGEISLKARLDRDLAKGKVIDEVVEGSYVTVNDSVLSPIQDIEILGNTVQNVNNLVDIKSTGIANGDGTFQYKLVVCGKNLFDKYKVVEGSLSDINGQVVINSNQYSSDYMRISLNMNYKIQSNPWVMCYDSDFKFIECLKDVSNGFEITNSKCTYIRFSFIKANLDKIQLEQGTQATTYEPYQETRATINLPCQLEKVVYVADRLYFDKEECAWCVEDNTPNLDLTEATWFKHIENDVNIVFKTSTYSSNVFNEYGNNIISNFSKSVTQSWNPSNVGISTFNNGDIYLCVEKTKATNVSELLTYLKSVNAYCIVRCITPSKIVLPKDVQIQLNSFAGTTNLYLNSGEVEGTIKATVAKSIGASVNANTQAINAHDKRIADIEGLKESQKLEYQTDKGYVVCQDTKNGVVEDLKIEGRTLVNECTKINSSKNVNVIVDVDKITLPNDGIAQSFVNMKTIKELKPNTKYTVKINVKQLSTNLSVVLFKENGNVACSDVLYVKTVGTHDLLFTTNNNIPNCIRFVNNKVLTTDTIINNNILILEGDHTQNTPQYFECLKSVGEDVEVMEVGTNNKNILPNDFSGGYINSGGDTVAHNSWVCSNNFIKVPQCGLYLDLGVFGGSKRIGMYNKSKECISVKVLNADVNYFNVSVDCKYIKISGRKLIESPFTQDEILSFKPMLYVKPITDNIEYKSHTKPLYYYNSQGELVPVPQLHEWDSIEKNSNGKYYYHKRSIDKNNFVGVSIITNYTNLDYVVLDKPSNALGYGVDTLFNFISDSEFKCGTKIGSTWDDSRHIGYMFGDANGWKLFIGVSKGTTIEQVNSKLLNKKFVYQLAQEEVYECVNLDLDTYDSETMLMANTGAISPKISFKISSYIGSVIQNLKSRINELEGKYINSLKMVLAGDMQALAYELYPEDFEEVIDTDTNYRNKPYYNI